SKSSSISTQPGARRAQKKAEPARLAARSASFEIPAEAKAMRERVQKWVEDERRPAEKKLLPSRPATAIRRKQPSPVAWSSPPPHPHSKSEGPSGRHLSAHLTARQYSTSPLSCISFLNSGRARAGA